MQAPRPRHLLNRPGEHLAQVALRGAYRRLQRAVCRHAQHERQQRRARRPQRAPPVHDQQQHQPDRDRVQRVVAQQHHARAGQSDAGQEPAAHPPRCHRLAHKRQRQHKQAGEQHVLRRVDGHHHVQRIRREEHRAPPGRPCAALPGDRRARRRKACRQSGHLDHGVQRRAEVDAAKRLPQLDAAAQQQRVQKRVMRRIPADEHLLQLKRHVVGKRTGKQNQQHRHIAGENRPKRLLRGKAAAWPVRLRAALTGTKQQRQHRHRRQQQRRSHAQCMPRSAHLKVLRLPAKAGHQRVHRAAQQDDPASSSSAVVHARASPRRFCQFNTTVSNKQLFHQDLPRFATIRSGLRALFSSFQHIPATFERYTKATKVEARIHLCSLRQFPSVRRQSSSFFFPFLIIFPST